MSADSCSWIFCLSSTATLSLVAMVASSWPTSFMIQASRSSWLLNCVLRPCFWYRACRAAGSSAAVGRGCCLAECHCLGCDGAN